MTISVSTVEDTMPPIIGTAIRRITSEPVPVDHRKCRVRQRPSSQAMALLRADGWKYLTCAAL